MFSRGQISEGGAIFPRKYGPQEGQISYEILPGGAKFWGGQISWDTGSNQYNSRRNMVC